MKKNIKQKFKMKKGDNVIIIAGKDSGKTGTVVKVLRDLNKVQVSGVNLVKKHTKATQTSAGGIITKELPLAISNVALLCPKTNKPTKVGYKTLESGKKVRFAKVSGEVIDN